MLGLGHLGNVAWTGSPALANPANPAPAPLLCTPPARHSAGAALFLSLPLSLGRDLWRKMHNMFYLPCGSHKIFTSSSHYSQSESPRALEPSLPDVPPPHAAPGPRRWRCQGLASRQHPPGSHSKDPHFHLRPWETPPGSAGPGVVTAPMGQQTPSPAPAPSWPRREGQHQPCAQRGHWRRGGVPAHSSLPCFALAHQARPDVPRVACATTWLFVATSPRFGSYSHARAPGRAAPSCWLPPLSHTCASPPRRSYSRHSSTLPPAVHPSVRPSVPTHRSHCPSPSPPSDLRLKR